MSKVNMKDLKELRARAGAGLKDCKNALNENNGDMEKAIDWLRKKGIAKAVKKAGRAASEGMVHSYIHSGSRLGVLVEVNCETDFVAKTEDFRSFVDDLAMHIVASRPQFVSEAQIPDEVVEKEKEIQIARAMEEGKPKNIAEKMVVGRIGKWRKEISLIDQIWMHDDEGKQTVKDILNAMVLKTGENVQIRRFVTFGLGEGLAKKEDNFVEEVAAMSKQ